MANNCRDLQDWGGDVSLARFMALPVEQYYELDPTMIKPLQGNRFALAVPRVHVSPYCRSASLLMSMKWSSRGVKELLPVPATRQTLL